MQQWRSLTLAIFVLGGLAVLASYVHGATTNPGKAAALWGGVPKGLLPAYTAMMFVAAAGYLVFSSYLFFGADWGATRLGFGEGMPVIPVLYLMILIPSALWMSLTIRMVDLPSPATWFGIRVVLTLVGLGALGILALLLALSPRPSGTWYWSAVVGALMFFVHTGILDAILWPAYFPR